MKTSLNKLLTRILRFGVGALAGLVIVGTAPANATMPLVGGSPGGMIQQSPFVNLGAYVAQHPEVVTEAGKLGLKGADAVADGVGAIQDSSLYFPVDAGMGLTEKLSDEIQTALKEGKNIGDLLDKHKDKFKSASDKIKVISLVLKGLKVAHLSGHVIETLYNGDRDKFNEALNNAVKEGLKMGGDAAGTWAGAALGAKGGALIGAWFGGVGAIPGAIIGGAVGGWLGGKGGEAAGEWINDNVVKDSTKSLGNWVFDSIHGKPPGPLLPPPLPGGSGGAFGGSSGGTGSGTSSQAPPKLKAFR